MKAHQKKGQPKKSGTRRSPETLEERVHRHLTDINSRITDNDVRDVKTEIGIQGETNTERGKAGSEENKRKKRKSKKQKQENETDSDKKYTTPGIF